ncbi:MAG: DUF1553 domain-containing protein [Roseibacillus sp.]
MRSLLLLTFVVSSSICPGEEKGEIDFNDHVQPILSEYCYHCHGPDGSTRAPNADKGGQPLRLDREGDAFEVREDLGVPVILKGDPENSELMIRILSDDKTDIMPPPKAHKVMKEEEIEVLRQWIAEGAPYEEHWSFTKPERPTKPELSDSSQKWVGNGVDAFVAYRHEKESSTPNPAEEPGRLLRRLSLDLTGLLPTAEQLAAWEGNVEKATEELLATDAYAEHFTRHWLDAARYADTHGIHIDNYRAIWPYRDWVIEAFRQNMPFDQFTREQIAGDLMPEPTLEQVIATGFGRCLPTTGEGGAIAEEWEAIYAQERVDTVSAVWLGLSTGCAACHDHKFDPITQKDNFAFSAFFRNTSMAALDRNKAEHPPNIFAPLIEDRGRWKELESELAVAQDGVTQRSKAADPGFVAWAEKLRKDGLSEGEQQPSTLEEGLVLSLGLNQDGDEIEGSIKGERKSWKASKRKFRDGPLGPATIVNDSGIALGDVGNLNAQGQASFGMLIYYEGKPNGPIIAKMDQQAKYRGWDFWMEKGRLASHLLDEWTDKGYKVVSNKVLEAGKWHHVMVTYDSAKPADKRVTMHLNGKVLATKANPNTAGDSFETTQVLRLGARSHGQKVTGGTVAIQDFRIYDRVLSAGELMTLADSNNFVPLNVAATTPLNEMSKIQQDALRRHYLNKHDGAYIDLKKKVAKLEKEQNELRKRGSVTLVMDDRKNREPFAHVLTRGDYRQKEEKVSPAVPGVLPALPSDVKADRLALANWLVNPENPLPARVTVNRIWYYFFGTGLVETTEDFGIMGARPTHPQLLDWLAVEFVESGWDLQHLVRLIVNSKTYQQSGKGTPEAREKDPDNRFLARGPRYRLDAEQIRDLALASSGLLVEKVGGPSVKPYQPKGVWSAVAMNNSNTRYYKEDSGDSLFRRSVYTFWKRTAPPSSMDLFDAPSREAFCVRRSRTNTPLQAFVLMNDPQFVEASRHLAQRALLADEEFEKRVNHIYQALLSRKARASEVEILAESLAAIEVSFQEDENKAKELLEVGATHYDSSLELAEFAAWTVLASQILNLDETITK